MLCVRLVLTLTLFSAVALTLPLASSAEMRGVSVQLRAGESVDAPVTKTVNLYAKSYALVIGIDNYTGGWMKLSNAVEDAREIADELAKRGFDVTFKQDLNADEMRKQLKEFFALKGADSEARLFLWYAGHGHTLKGEGYLVPSDAPQPIIPEFKVKAIHMREFPGFMRLADSKHVFAVFDSCFAGTVFASRAGAAPAAITRATTMPVRQFLSSGDADQTVSDDGTFRKLFLRALWGEERADANGDGYLTGSELGIYLADRVTNLTEQAQTPRYGKLRDPDYDRGDFVFVLPGRQEQAWATPEVQVPVESQESLVDIMAWAAIAAGDTVEEFDGYLKDYPNGRFAATAQRKIEGIKARETAGSGVETQALREEETTALQITPEQEIVEAKEEGGVDDWFPVAPSEASVPVSIGALTRIEEPAVKVSGTLAGGMKDGALIDPKTWKFSNPKGDGAYKATGKWLHMKVGGGHNIWDCNRGSAPLLMVDAPKTDKWTAQVKFEMPSRAGRSHIGLSVWNGQEERPVHLMTVGPSETGKVSVGGSYRDDCTGGSTDLSRISGNRGGFVTSYEGSSGWLRISRNGHYLNYYFKSPFKKQWQELGSMLVTAKDRFDKVGLMIKTWGNKPVQVSFSDFRLMPGMTGVRQRVPGYFAKLEKASEITFSKEDFLADSEWSDPQGDSLNEITDGKVRLKVPGGHNIWDCNRLKAPMLTIEPPPVDTWTAQVKFDMPARGGRSHAGMVLWNGSEDRPVHVLYAGPAETDSVAVGGSYRDDCTAGSDDMRYIKGNSGEFRTLFSGTKGWLRVSRKGDEYSFHFKPPFKKQWKELGRVQTTEKDGFNRIGFSAKTWSGKPVEVTFSDFKVAVGVAGARTWIPSYISGLVSGEPVSFSGRDFADFEWSDPNGDSMHKITGSRVLMKVNGSHNVWDCNRGLAPMLTVMSPPQDTWVAEVRFSLPKRVNRSHTGLAISNGRDDRPVNLLVFGPESNNHLGVAGSYQDDCTAGAGDLSKHPGNSGEFNVKSGITHGRLRIIKTGMVYRFSYRAEADAKWHEIGRVQTTVRDGFNRIGLIGKTWGGDPLEVEFSRFTLLPGGWR